MNNLFLLLAVISFVAVFVFAILTIVNFMKDKNKGMKMLKRFGISFGVLILSFILFGVTLDESEVSKEEDKKVETSAPVKEETAEEKKARETKEAEEKAANEAKKAEEKAASEAKKAEEKAAAEQKAKAEAEKKKADEKNHYLNDIKPQVDSVTVAYDSYWSEIWQPTFAGLGTSVDIYTAYENMKILDNNYKVLDKQIANIDSDKLSKDNKKLLKEYVSSMRDAASARRIAVQNAQDIFDKGTFSPSEISGLKTDVEVSDSHLMNAVIQLTTMELALGIER